MDARSVLQENVSTTLSKASSQFECRQVDELAGVEDDLQIGVESKHKGSSRFDQVSPTRACDK